MMLPTLISVSLAPGSYFFSAKAGFAPIPTASVMDASHSMPRRAIESSQIQAGCYRSCGKSRWETGASSSNGAEWQATAVTALVTGGISRTGISVPPFVLGRLARLRPEDGQAQRIGRDRGGLKPIGKSRFAGEHALQ